MLYVRMLISMLVGLYTSRVVLQTLGVEDFGIFGVVGGVVSMMGFLNASMSGATSRFITFELGKGDLQRVRDTFSSALIIHIGIALIVILAAETIGLWFFFNKLVIPEERMDAAFWVYQCSIISAAVSITQTPYTAVIMSREKMDIYAYMELLNVSLKLLIVYLLVIGNFDKLILYSILTLVVSVVIAMLYRLYCVRHYVESHFHWVWDRQMLKPLVSFSGWDLYGNLCGTAKQQGTTILLNMFFGPIVNTGASIANTIIGIFSGLSLNVVTAFRPQIIKQYAQGEIPQMTLLITRSMALTSFLLSLIVFPIVVQMPFVLNLWLGSIPDYSVVLAQIAVFNSFVGNINAVELIPLHATGNIKRVSIYGGSLYLLNIIADYIFLRFLGINAYWVMGVNLMFMFFVLVTNAALLKIQIKQISIKHIASKYIIPILFISVLLFFIGQYISSMQPCGWLPLIELFFCLAVLTTILYFVFVFSYADRLFFFNIVQKLSKKCIAIIR